jgi:hypothetical protein
MSKAFCIWHFNHRLLLPYCWPLWPKAYTAQRMSCSIRRAGCGLTRRAQDLGDRHEDGRLSLAISTSDAMKDWCTPP